MKPQDYELALGLILAFVAFTIFTCLYLLPTFIAYRKEKKDRLAILIINIFLGASVVGWLIALIWSLTSDKKSKAEP